MSLFKKFLKPKWQHSNPDVRRQALAEMAAEQLISFIDTEPDEALRKAAVVRIRDEALLESLLGHNLPDVRDTTREHWLNLLLPSSADLNSITHSATLVRIAGLTKDQQLRLDAIARISDQNERLVIAREHPVAKVRLAAAEGIDQHALLQQLLEFAQAKDKAVYRLCKERLAAAKANQEAIAARKQQITYLLEQAAYLNRVGYGPDFNGRLQVIQRQQQELNDSLTDEQRHTLESALLDASRILEQHAAEEQRQAEEQQRQAEAQAAQQQLVSELNDALAAAPSSTDPEALKQQLQAIDERWRATQTDHKADADALRSFENTMQQALALQATLEQVSAKQQELSQWLEKDLPADMRGLQQVIQSGKKWQAQLKWPSQLEAPEWLAALSGKRQIAEIRLTELENQQTARMDTLQRQLDKLEQHIDNGHLKDAGKLYGQVHQSLRQVDGKAAYNFQNRIKSLAARLNEMRDWQGFVTTPKKEALCESMEALIDADISPDVLADKIQVLQDEWKTLNSSQPDKALWDRFQAAGDKAFEPCRAWFADVARQREVNVERRNQLIEELRHYEANLDWDQADWKVVQKTLETAREVFRGYSPVDRAAHKHTQEHFRAACDAIYSHLKAEYDRNLAAKAALVEAAADLAEEEDLTDVVERVKELQQRWKEIGITPRAPDQKYWRQFRSQCDAVFARLDEQRNERKAELNNRVIEAEELVNQAAALPASTLSAADVLEQFQQYEQQFAAIELPRSAHQRLRKQLADIAAQLDDRQVAQSQAEERQRWQGLLDRLQALADHNESLWHDADQLPDGYPLAAFEQRWQQDQDTPVAIDTDAARDLCIRMEVISGLESPAADQGRRMQLQVQRLAQAMGQSIGHSDERLALVLEWLATPAGTAQQQRFIQALKASIG
ncbi:DUF349 domain-containing protein [Oceanobacter sp. 3_MG-2023]|uniref:DUF349 domain-containing protein n=1 Tax=Oceanobacter sp. 3_MG-2023 TaxID=3062622 RepID=UPI0027345EEA|nr:DUF349 domain-containing protein [Oceanobacter sp. 3_MG-2023]MDP2506202.1 DUF349 domain-containing protein [Oceanobacter sp. 3_MG-2023]